MDARVYWIWAQQAFRPGSPMPVKIAGQYAGGLREFCEGGPKLWNTRRDIRDSEAVAMRDFSLNEAEARLEYAERVGWQVLTPQCGKYPELLKNIPNPPAVLYGKGNLPDVDNGTPVAVVGSRHPLPGSANAARHFGYQLAAGGACVVSGGAEGVDKLALTEAMRIPGSQLISVLPVSLDSPYLASNARLRSMICTHGGALLTEYFSQHSPEHGTFAFRNRLITGLCRGVVIIQAGEKGGGPLYAARALEQDRDVFVYPGPEDAPEFAGSRALLEDGAKAATCGEDVLAEYGVGGAPSPPSPRVEELFRDLVIRRPGERAAPVPSLRDPGLSPEARRVWEALDSRPQSVSQLEEKTGMSASALLGLLTELELEGLADSLPGKRYIRAGGV